MAGIWLVCGLSWNNNLFTLAKETGVILVGCDWAMRYHRCCTGIFMFEFELLSKYWNFYIYLAIFWEVYFEAEMFDLIPYYWRKLDMSTILNIFKFAFLSNSCDNNLWIIVLSGQYDCLYCVIHVFLLRWEIEYSWTGWQRKKKKKFKVTTFE